MAKAEPDQEESLGAEDQRRIPRVPVAPVPGFGISDESVEPSLEFPRSQQDAASRLFNSRSFRRLWLAQVVSSLGDWIGLVAVTALAARIGGGQGIGLALAARLVPGFFLGTVASVFADRLDRRKLMVCGDVGRGLVLITLPFVNSLWQLLVASLLLEAFTLLWMPAKEASVPSIVDAKFLPTANSLSLVAAYGTFPVGAAMFAFLAKISEWTSSQQQLASFSPDRFTLAFYVDAVTFFISAVLIFGLAIPGRARDKESGPRVRLAQTFVEMKEGIWFIRSNPRVRAVIFGLATGLIGGGMLVPLGSDFAIDVLGAGEAGFGLLQTALGVGLAIGVIGLLLVQRHLPVGATFVVSVYGAGVCIAAAASTSTLSSAMLFIGLLGLFAGGVYVLGFTILQQSVSDEMRGRTFGALYTLVRLCLLLAFVGSPFLSKFLDRSSARWFDRDVQLLGVDVALPGVRLTLWLGSLIILFAGVIATVNLRAHQRAEQVNHG